MGLPSARIAIIGGGPAGLTLGVLLHKQGIPFTIYELRQKPTKEELTRPAGSLDLHEESGLAALRECGIIDEFTPLTNDCTEADKVSDKNGNILFVSGEEPGDRPEIARHKLIQLLLSHVPETSIKWSHKLHSTSIQPKVGYSEVKLDFGVNGVEFFDLVVGADGAWSKVRNLLNDLKPTYAGIHVITLDALHFTSKHPGLSDLIGKGTFSALGDRHVIATQRSVQDSVRIYILLSTKDRDFATTTKLREKTPTKAKFQLVENSDAIFGKWGSSIKELIVAACDDQSAMDPDAKVDIKALYTLPIGHTWQHREGATLIGDAAHLINPPAGEGVNIAMKDALLLSQAIKQGLDTAGANAPLMRKTLDSSINDFEVDMAARAKEMGEAGLMIQQKMFGTDEAAQAMADFFTQ